MKSSGKGICKGNNGASKEVCVKAVVKARVEPRNPLVIRNGQHSKVTQFSQVATTAATTIEKGYTRNLAKDHKEGKQQGCGIGHLKNCLLQCWGHSRSIFRRMIVKLGRFPKQTTRVVRKTGSKEPRPNPTLTLTLLSYFLINSTHTHTHIDS